MGHNVVAVSILGDRELPKVTPKRRDDAQAVLFQESYTIPANHWLLLFPDDTFNVLSSDRFREYYEINGVSMSVAREAPPPVTDVPRHVVEVPSGLVEDVEEVDVEEAAVEDEPPQSDEKVPYTPERNALTRKLWGVVPHAEIVRRANRLPGRKIVSAGALAYHARHVLKLPSTRAYKERPYLRAADIYTPERIRFISENFATTSTARLYDQVNAMPGQPLRKREAFSVWLPAHGFRRGALRNKAIVDEVYPTHVYTPERQARLRELHGAEMSWGEIYDHLNRLPGEKIPAIADLMRWCQAIGLRYAENTGVGTRITRTDRMALETTINGKHIATTAQRVRVLAGLAQAEAVVKKPIPETVVQQYLRPFDANAASFRLQEMVEEQFLERSSSNPILWRITSLGLAVVQKLGETANEYYKVK